jgi:hypothetical protein
MLTRHDWDEALHDRFVVYLAGHNRPTHEVLFPNEKPLEAVFAAEFQAMTTAPARLQALLATRHRMLQELPRALLPRHCEFLLSIVRAEPDWSLPSARTWRLKNYPQRSPQSSMSAPRPV